MHSKVIQDIAQLRTLESELAASEVRRKFLKEKAVWLKQRIEEGYSSEVDQLWIIGSKLNDEDALIAKIDVLARTQRYKLAKQPVRSGKPCWRIWKGRVGHWAMDEIVELMGREHVVADLVAEIRKGKHVILVGPVGIGKSAVLKAALANVGDKLELLT